MKNTVKLLLIITVFCLCAVNVCAYHTDDNGYIEVEAAVDVSDISFGIYTDYENAAGDIAYVLKENSSARVLSYVVLKPEAEFDLLTNENYANNVISAGYTNISDDGSYVIPVRIKGKSGIYKLIVKNKYIYNEIDIEHEYKIYIEFNDILKLQNNELMQKFVEENTEALMLDVKAYALLSDGAKSDLMQILSESEKVSSNDELFELISSLKIADKLFESADSAQTLLEYMESKLDVEESVFSGDLYSVFSKQLDAEKKLDILKGYMGTPFDDAAALKFKFDVFKALTSELDYILEWENYILDEQGIWGFDKNAIEDYEDSEKTQVLKDVKKITESAESMSEVIKEFTESVKDNPKKIKTSSGGGGGSKTSGSVKTVSVTPSKAEEIQKEELKPEFEDIEEYAWAKEAIHALSKQNIVNGVSEKLFAPSASVKREEFVKMLTVGLRLTGVGAEVSFDDVEKNDWFYSYVAAAQRIGIVKGNGENKFGTGKSITREDMAVMLKRTLNVKKLTVNNVRQISFSDESEISDYAMDAVMEMAQAGILSGNDDGSFNPGGCLTRAEAAAALYNFFVKTNIL